jgi:hypothetical protein
MVGLFVWEGAGGHVSDKKMALTKLRGVEIGQSQKATDNGWQVLLYTAPVTWPCQVHEAFASLLAIIRPIPMLRSLRRCAPLPESPGEVPDRARAEAMSSASRGRLWLLLMRRQCFPVGRGGRQAYTKRHIFGHRNHPPWATLLSGIIAHASALPEVFCN